MIFRFGLDEQYRRPKGAVNGLSATPSPRNALECRAPNR